MQIKLKYRLALVLVRYFRDHAEAGRIIKHLKKYCNTWGKVEMYKEVEELRNRIGEYVNARDKGRFKVKEIVERGVE